MGLNRKRSDRTPGRARRRFVSAKSILSGLQTRALSWCENGIVVERRRHGILPCCLRRSGCRCRRPLWSSQREDPAEPAPAGSSGRVYCLTCEPKLQANAPRCVASRGQTADAMPSKAREIDARLSLASGHWPFWTLAQRRALVAPGTRRAALDGARNRSINLGGKASSMCDHVQAGTAVPKTKSFASCSSASPRQGCDDRIDRVRTERGIEK